jgi:CHAT domain-containing protein
VAGALFAVERGRARAILDSFGETRVARRPLATSELQSALAEDAAIVVFSQLKGRVVAFVLRDDDLAIVQVPQGRERELMQPIQRRLARTSTVAVIGDPALRRIPEKLLIASMLGEQVIVESPSATLAIESSRSWQVLNAHAPLVIAATIFDGKAGDAQPLPQVFGEARAVADIWSGARILAAAEATRAAFLREATAASLIHFAGHGVHRTTHPSDARLLLAPDGMHRSYITAGEIAKLHFSSTQLVVLNACRAAATSNRSDGVMNLATAFAVAGVRDVIASAEDVDDATASAFAVRLHHHLRAGLTPPAALREVVREARTRFGTDRAAAMYGGFTVLGGSKTLVRHDSAVMQRRMMR